MTKCLLSVFIVALTLLSNSLLAQNTTKDLDDLYANSKWGNIISSLNIKNELKPHELELLVKSYADSASFLQINGIETAALMYQKAFEYGVKKNLFPTDNKSLLAQAIGYFCQQQFSSAKAILTDLIDKNPQESEYHYWYWSVDISSGNSNMFQHPNLLKGLELDPKSTDILMNLGMLYYNSKDYINSQTYLKKCIDIKDDFYQRYFYGCTFSQQQNWEEAKKHLSICIDQRPDFAMAYYVLGSIEIYQGNIKGAVSLFKKSLQIVPSYLSYVENMKQYYPALKEYNFVKKVEIRPSVDLLNTGIQKSNNGQYAKSIGLIETAIEEFRKETPMDTAMLVSAYNWQVVNYYMTREYERSNQLAKAILNLPYKSDFQTAEQATLYAYIANNYQAMGDELNAMKNAIESFQRVEKMESTKQHRLTGASNVAYLALEAEEYDYADSYINKAKEIQKASLFNLEDAIHLLELSIKLKIQNKNYKAALKEINLATESFDFSTAPEMEHILDELKFKVYVQNHDITRASKTLKLLEKSKNQTGLFKFYYSELIADELSDYWVQQNRNHEAFQVMRHKLNTVSYEMYLNFPYMSEIGKSMHYAKNNEWLAKYFSYLYLNKDEKLSKNKIVYGAAASNFFKNAIINNNNKLFRLIHQRQDHEAISYLDTLQMVKERLRNDNLSEDDRKEFVKSETRILNFLSERYSIQMQQDYLDYTDYQEKIPEKDAVINIVRFDFYDFEKSSFTENKSLYAFIVLGKNRNTEIRFLENGDLLENKYYSSYRSHIKFQIQDDKSFKQYFGKVADVLNDSENTWIVADGIYHFINPNSLYVPDTKKYLIEQNNIRLINKFEGKVFDKNENSFTTATIIGNPNFDIGHQEITSTIDQLPYEIHIDTDQLYTSRASRSTSEKVPRLPGTQKEIENINTTLTKNNIRINSFAGDQAIEPIIKNQLNGSILHFATHGVFENTDNDLNNALNAGLLLSGVNSHLPDPNIDGFLSAKEIEDLLLYDTDLLVLSACETGQGTVKDGQGVFGLQRAFINAGVDQLVMSLWKVDDEATSLLMTYFYENLFSEESVDLAFKKAQLQLKEKFPNPYHWGAFVLVK
ncbi:CHAT domain-containing protein [Reichenbachiella versicolor]|uniref:CHAT domain-containing protein n=1 Tax=Reichenbachiella versicolor TaxID=1821036 RepID=UPI000D6DE4E3|nr:CHAT domain-containing protein [Reichenbachiella versicolor]